MSTAPPIQSSGPVISPDVPWETRRHLQLLYQKLGNHTQAFALQQQAIANLKSGSTTTNIIEGGGGAAPIPPPPSTGFIGQGLINNQTGATSYLTQPGDNGILLILNDASPVAVTLTTNAAPFYLIITNFGVGTATLTPSTGTVNGGASLSLLQNQTVIASCDSTSWETTAISSGSGINQLTGDVTAGPGTGSQAATVVSTHLAAPLPVAQGGTGTATPSLVAGANVTVTGTWPNQTVSASTTTVTAYVVRIKTANYTAVANDAVFCNTSGGGFTVTLPSAAANSGVAIIVKKTTIDTNGITVAGAGGDLVDGAASQALGIPYSAYMLVSDGVSNWGVI